ncbi:MAG: sulfatase-like hydrolase/transferase, partial [Fuerstiella sp.]|nr:sulfatase-like hydrolase/transferase [Fuerstiella sp.]
MLKATIQKSLALAVFTFMAVAAYESHAIATERPNIVFIMADDLGYGDLGCYGQRLMATPRIDRLASEGTRLTHAYAGGPVSTSPRSVLMTGLHTRHTPARDNAPHYHS